MSRPLISICIPAYKKVQFLERLLTSIAQQTFHDYEVIVTDDSPDLSVQELCNNFKSQFILIYFKNEPSLGSPENWNEGIRKANGVWIKMMHDDDWFQNKYALQKFAEKAKKQSTSTFIFSAFTEIDLTSLHHESYITNRLVLKWLRKSPLILFRKNYIGHPSTTLIKNSLSYYYDKNLKWVVDIEFYMRYLQANPSFTVIHEPLINIGLHEQQITKEAFRNPEIEIPEVLYLANKLPDESFKHIAVYDYYWRFLRNLSIRSLDDIWKYAPGINVPDIITEMIQDQSSYPLKKLKIGLISKLLMLKSYFSNYKDL
ncbi:MAG TPA: glycosyltransferase [Bacillales bacterium]|nr:glycosyltransferase [Bacillales bacterium]